MKPTLYVQAASATKCLAFMIMAMPLPQNRRSPGPAMTGLSSASVVAPTSPAQSLPVSDLPENRHRRLLELRLLHQWVTRTALSLSTDAALGEPMSKEETDNWIVDQPNIALGSDSALYMLYSVSALHLARCEPQKFEYKEAYRQYFDVGLRKHSVEVSDLSKANIDVVCMTSSLIRVTAFASLQERNLDPYTPPIQWIQVGIGGNPIPNFRLFHDFPIGNVYSRTNLCRATANITAA